MEQTNKKIELAINLIFWLSTVSFIILFIVNAHDLYKKEIGICFTNICLGNFFQNYGEIIKIPTAGVALLTLLFLWHASNIYVHTYKITHQNNKNSQEVNQKTTYLNHYKNFTELLEQYINKIDYINTNSIDKYEFYHFIHNDPLSGDFTISQNYIDFINDINLNIVNLKNNAIRDKEYKDHINNMINKFLIIGFEIPNCQRKEFMKIEVSCYDLLNLINKSIKVKHIESPSHCF
ncbi:retron Ec48 family effector membrane protein [Acinetobacter baumannii]|uniref:retron Ec48 family effector membrane protein n=1 Tax=Acinetobacter baumannii TaxID=470 RepID=UPI002543EFD8|nr:retron Ec48 family effector membrane protein [Acinetobacter baumannii]WIH74673.1 retron Ec48 family effector membrane protein [Acinetobacter baumannii]